MARTLIIAEAGVNHDGDMRKAKALVDAAANAGADMVKFQTFSTDALVSPDAPKAAYQQRTTESAETQYEMLRKLELRREDFAELKDYCASRGTTFLSTPFDPASAQFLIELGPPYIKIGSGDMTNAPLLLQIAKAKRPMILSTGMATLDEVEEALGVVAFGYMNTGDAPSRKAFAEAWNSSPGRTLVEENLVLLHCTTEYPCPPEDANLMALHTMRETFGLRVGFSDHCGGATVSVAAVAMGAEIIEKHLTLDSTAPGPDHAASMEPGDLAEMIREIRLVEAARGDGVKGPRASETANIPVARKGLYAARDIEPGTVIAPEDIACRRPANGRAPIEYWELVGHPTTAAKKAGDPW